MKQHFSEGFISLQIRFIDEIFFSYKTSEGVRDRLQSQRKQSKNDETKKKLNW